MSYLFFDIAKATAAIPGLIAFRPKLVYENDKAKKRVRGGALVVANHFGFFDPVYLQYSLWYRRMHFVCLKHFFDGRFRWVFKAVHCIPVDRDRIEMETIREVTGCLKNGKVVAMFPEGHINVSPETLDTFKSGAVLMALKGNSPIVPVYIRPRRNKLERLVLVIGEKFDVKENCSGGIPAIEECSRLLRTKEEELQKIAEEIK